MPTHAHQPGGLQTGDWLVLLAYGAVLVGAGVYWSRRAAKSEQDYFFASRSMPAWVVAVSLIATAQSAATFLGVPQSSYAGSLSYLLGSMGALLASIIAAGLYLRAYHGAGVRTPLELIERHAGTGAMRACAWTFVLGKTLSAGVRTYIGAIPLSLALFGDVALGHVGVCVAGIVVAGTAFTLMGGLRSVVWTDVLQVVVYMGAAIAAIVWLAGEIPGGISGAFATLHEATTPQGVPKLRVLDLGVDARGTAWGREFTLLTALGGLLLINLAVMVVDQDFVQRSLACESPKDAAKSAMLAQAMGLPVVLVFLMIGSLLFAREAGAVGAVDAGGMKDAFERVISSEMPSGLRGLMLAGVLAIGPIGINATLNSLASLASGGVLWRVRDTQRLGAARARVLVAGVAGVLLAVSLACAAWREATQMPLIDMALKVFTFAYAGLLAVVTTVLLLKRGNGASIVLALFVSIACGVLIEIGRAMRVDDGWFGGVVRVAFPWHMVLCTGLALVVCMCGTRREARA